MQQKIKTRLEFIHEFEEAPLSALFSQDSIAAIRHCSAGLLQRERVFGGGPQFQKIKGRVLYRKSDVLDWLNQFQFVSSTSEQGAA